MSESLQSSERQPEARDRLAWSARPTRELVRIAGPIAISMLSFSTMTLADTLFVGRLGSSALAGVGLGGVASFTALCFSIGFLRAIKIVGAQAEGAGDDALLREAGATGVVFAWVLGTLTLIVGGLAALALPLISATEASGQAATDYMQVRMLGAPIVLTYVALREYRYSRGDSVTPTFASIAGHSLNIGLDALFILVLDWGVAGAAAATVIGQFVELLVLALRPLDFGREHFSRATARKIWNLGLPTGMQFLLEVGAFTMLSALLAALDEREMAAHQVGIQVLHFAFLPGFAIADATSVLAGQAMGGQRPALVRVSAARGMLLAGGWALGSTLLLIVFGDAVSAAFGLEEGVAEVLRRLLYVAAFFQLADAANTVARGVLRGVGDVRFAAVLGIVTAWVLTPPLTYLLGYGLGWGAVGGWITLTSEICVGAVVMWWRLATVLRRPDMRNEIVTAQPLPA